MCGSNIIVIYITAAPASSIIVQFSSVPIIFLGGLIAELKSSNRKSKWGSELIFLNFISVGPNLDFFPRYLY